MDYFKNYFIYLFNSGYSTVTSPFSPSPDKKKKQNTQTASISTSSSKYACVTAHEEDNGGNQSRQTRPTTNPNPPSANQTASLPTNSTPKLPLDRLSNMRLAGKRSSFFGNAIANAKKIPSRVLSYPTMTTLNCQFRKHLLHPHTLSLLLSVPSLQPPAQCKRDLPSFFTYSQADYHSILDSGLYSDLTIRVNHHSLLSEKLFHVHRCILCSQSTYFKSACSTNFIGGRNQEIILRNISPDIISSVLSFLYTRSHTFTPDTALRLPPRLQAIQHHIDVYADADYFDIPDLKAHCMKQIDPNILSKFTARSLIEIIVKAASFTSNSDWEMLDPVLDVVAREKNRLMGQVREDFMGLLEGDGRLAVELVKRLN